MIGAERVGMEGTGLRRAVVAAGLSGQLAATVAGVLPWPALCLAAAVLAGGSRAALAADARRARLLRAVASGLILLLVLLTPPRALAGGGPGAARDALGLLLVGVVAAQGLTWRTVRDLRVGLLGALGLLVLGASYSPDVFVGLPLLTGWAAVLVAGMRLHQLRVAPGGIRLGQLAPPTALAMVLGLVAFLLVPAAVSASLRGRLGQAVSGNSPLGEAAPRSPGSYRSASLDLRSRGTLSDEAVARVPAASPALWRATTYDHYDGATWTTPPARSVLVGPPSPLAATRTYLVTLATEVGGTVWSPGPVQALVPARPGGVEVGPFGDVVTTGRAQTGYRVTSSEQVADPQLLRGARGADEDDRRWRELPRSLPDRVAQLAGHLTRGAPSRYDAVLAVEGWLRTHATYRLDSPVPGPDEDAVDRFLFTDRTGFCEQFASAEAVLLRAVGIPARLVTGLAYGVPDSAGRRRYRQADLHAWVEVAYPGVGWSPSDPTAGAVLAVGGRSAAVHRSLRRRLAAAGRSSLVAIAAVPGGRPAVAAGLLLLTGLVTLVLARRRPPRRTPRPGPGAAPGAPAGPALAAFLRLDARLGANGRRPAESIGELRARLGVLGPAAEALGVVEQECYGRVPPPAEPAVRVLDGLVTGSAAPRDR